MRIQERLITFSRHAIAGSLLLAGGAMAQDALEVSLSDETGTPGATATVTFGFTGNGETSGFGGDFVIGDPGAFSNVDLSDCLSGNSSAVGTCVHPGGDTSRVRILLANDEVTPLADFTGTIDFTIDAGALPGVVSLTWDETAWDTAAPEADVNGTDGSVEVVTAEPVLDVTPASLDFTAQSGTTSPAQSVEACNAGDAGGLTFSGIALGGANPGNFTITDNQCAGADLGVGECCNVSVAFAPDAVAGFNATLGFTSTGGDTDVALSGSGQAGPAPAIGLAPTSHDFGTLEPGDSDAASFTVTNTGDADGLDIASATVSGDAPFALGTDTCSGASLDAGATCSVQVMFSPGAEGSFTGSLMVDSNAGGASASLAGAADAVPGFSSSPVPSGVNLGAVQPGGNASGQVVITNTGSESLSVDCGLLDDPNGVFGISPDPVVFPSIAPGDSASFTVSGQADQPGSYTATMSCSTTDPDNPVVDFEFALVASTAVIPTLDQYGLLLLMLALLAIAAYQRRRGRI